MRFDNVFDENIGTAVGGGYRGSVIPGSVALPSVEVLFCVDVQENSKFL